MLSAVYVFFVHHISQKLQAVFFELQWLYKANVYANKIKIHVYIYNIDRYMEPSGKPGIYIYIYTCIYIYILFIYKPFVTIRAGA